MARYGVASGGAYPETHGPRSPRYGRGPRASASTARAACPTQPEPCGPRGVQSRARERRCRAGMCTGMYRWGRSPVAPFRPRPRAPWESSGNQVSRARRRCSPSRRCELCAQAAGPACRGRNCLPARGPGMPSWLSHRGPTATVHPSVWRTGGSPRLRRSRRYASTTR